MLRLIDAALARGPNVLYRRVSLIAAPGERIGLVGANGCGKSSLFAAILGELGLDAGEIERPHAQRVAHVAQDIEASGEPALDYVLGGHAPLIAARAELQAAQAAHDDVQRNCSPVQAEMRLAQAHASLADLNEGAIVAAAKTVLHGLGFAEHATRRPVAEFSGGWRNRLALARALLRPADLILLDEPTNHLDLDSVIWLEAWLRRQPATVLIISHDREFLDRAAETIWHIDQQAIKRYAGNYSAFELAWLEQRRQQDAAAKAYQRTAAHLQQFVDRFRAKATKARQAQSRLKMLERLTAIEPARAPRQWRFEFPAPVRVPEHLLNAEDLQLGYGERIVVSGVRFNVRAGERTGILGVNGAGKSTVVKAVAGELAPQRGELRRGQGLVIGYFAQHQLDQLRPGETPLDHLRRLALDTGTYVREQDLRDFLGQYRFGGELIARPIDTMSGGEKARCALALIAWRKPNLLVLDEPTNHFDMETREALTMALSSYEGALLLVSHDRHLLRATTDQLWLVHDGRLAPFDGDLDDYAAIVLASRRERAKDAAKDIANEAAQDDAAPSAPAPAGRPSRQSRQRAAQERQRLAGARRPIQNKLAKLEAELAQVATQLRELDAKLSDAGFYHAGDADQVATTLKQRGELAQRLDALEASWLELTAELEAIS